MASRPSGLRQPSAVRSSNTNLAASSGVSVGMDAPVQTPAKPAAPPSTLSMSRLPSSNSIRRKITTPAGIHPPGSRDSGLATDTDNYIIGDVVYVNGDQNKRGKICFIGEVDFARGDFAGIVLDLPMGNHDGMVQGKRYFQCAASHGLFTKLTRLTREPLVESPSTPRAPQSAVSSAMVSPDPQMSSAASIAERTPSPSPAKSTTSFAMMNSSLALGERVIVASATGGTKIGILRYLGGTEFAAGDWAGVELLTPMGKNNGSVGGKTYFTCKERHGLFVPASKVISSPINKTPRRHGSRESLISVSSLASSAASRSIRRPSMRDSQCLPSCSLQAVLAEKEKHMERLIKERELDRVDLANLSRQYEEKILDVKRLQSECAGYQQQIETAAEVNETVARLQNALEEEHRKLEDLQYTLDEEKIMKADMQTQLDSLSSKLTQSEDSSKSNEVSKIELDKRDKELEEVKAQLLKREDEIKAFSTQESQAKEQIQNFQKTMEEMKQNASNLVEQLSVGNDEKSKLVAAHEDIVTNLKKSLAEQTESVTKLTQQLADKKRREEELKEKNQKLETEYTTIHKQKCSLESEVMDLVNSKSNTSDVLTSKIKDLNQELQDLRVKLESTEEDKAVLRRINAEFKSRLAQHEQIEATLKKQVEETEAKLLEVKDSLEKQLQQHASSTQNEKGQLEEKIASQQQEIILLKDTVSKLEESISAEKSVSDKLVKELESIKMSAGQELATKATESEQKLKSIMDDKIALEAASQKKQKELTDSNTQLGAQLQQLTSELSSSKEQSNSLNAAIEKLKSDLNQSDKETKEKTAIVEGLEGQLQHLKKQVEVGGSALDGLQAEYDTLKKDKATLKEQLDSFKGESSRFKEIEKGLSQEVVVLRNKLEQQTKIVCELDKELNAAKSEIDSSKSTLLDANSPQAHIEFLNSIIVDLQRKNEELNVKLNVLINGTVEADSNSNRVPSGGASSMKALQSLRPYCDICEKFDLHDTEDCPAQVSEDNTHYGSNRGESRPYCDTCEIFGHITGECDDQETY